MGAEADLGHLGELIDQACDQHQLPDPREAHAVDNRNRANSAAYLRALRSQLATLGYVTGQGPDSEDPQVLLDPPLKAAIRHFQDDAGFVGPDVDGWAGPESAARLRQLVSFEEGQQPADWDPALTRGLAALPAVHRAVHVRLQSLCFIADEAVLTPDSVVDVGQGVTAAGLARFLDAARRLGLCGPILSPRLDARVLGLVFGHDAMLSALADNAAFCRADDNRPFVAAVGRIELWLMGYDVGVRGPRKSIRVLVRPAGPRAGNRFTDVDLIARSLDDFDSRTGGPKSPGARDTDARFNADFFHRCRTLSAASDLSQDGAGQDELIHRFAASQSSLVDDLVDSLKSVAASLWDGAKRLWGWLSHAIRSLVSGAVDAGKALVWNLARWIASGAREAFTTVAKAVDIVHRGIVVLHQRWLPGSDPAVVLVRQQTDFDLHACFAADAPPDRLTGFGQARLRDAQLLGKALRILGRLLDALAEVGRSLALAPPLGWLTLLFGLSRIKSDLAGIRDEVLAADLGTDSLYLNPVS
jgi:hypothetical protein